MGTVHGVAESDTTEQLTHIYVDVRIEYTHYIYTIYSIYGLCSYMVYVDILYIV